MKKTIEIAEVKKQILEGVAEFEKETVDYYLHLTEDGKIVSNVSDADESFICSVPYERYGLREDGTDENSSNENSANIIYAHEVDGDDIFEEISRNLWTKANQWLEEQGEWIHSKK